jgi:hypothetical protein
MRALPVAIALSVAANTAALAWVTSREPKVLIPLPVRAAALEPEVEPPLMVVELLDDHSVPIEPIADLAEPTQRGVAPERVHRDRGHVAISTGPAPAVETPAPMPAPENPPRPNLLTMRRPRLDQGPSAQFVDDFLARTKPIAPRQDVGDEGAREQIAMAQSKLGDARFMEHASGDEVRVQREKLARARGEIGNGELNPTGDGTYGSKQDVFAAHVEADGTVHLEDGPNLKVTGAGARFDVTDWQMRSHGMDPYASRKLAFLDRTRDQRVEIGRRYKHQQLAQSAELMQRNLNRLAATAPDLQARKRGLFELWDDCAEAGDGDLVAGGAAARARVVGYIRAQLRGADAYTADELARLNARRRSKLPFAPYD